VDGDAAAGHKLADYLDVAWMSDIYNVVHYSVNTVLVEVAMVTVAKEILFK
jgi:hypothetical protein